MKNNNRFIVIIITIVIAVIFYQNQYSVDLINLESKIEDYIKKENVILHTYNEIDLGDETYLFATYEFKNQNGVVALVKGINNKYRLNSAYFTNKNIDFVDISLSGVEYLLIFGRLDETVASIDVKVIDHPVFSVGIGDTNILAVYEKQPILYALESYEINYTSKKSKVVKVYSGSTYSEEYEDFVYSGDQGQVKVAVLLILFFGYLISFLFKKGSKYKGFKRTAILPVKHRIN